MGTAVLITEGIPLAAYLVAAPRVASALTFLAAVTVALFHKDPQRRSDARAVLDLHPLRSRRGDALPQRAELDSGTAETAKPTSGDP